jgi:hypothetical protein
MKMENQITLNGSKALLLPVILPVQDLTKFYNRDDSIWETLKFFYNADLEGMYGVTRENLWKAHYMRGKPICNNTLINNLKRLEGQFLVKCVRKDFGSKRNAKFYCISEKGKCLWEAHEFSSNKEKTYF